MFSSYFFLSHLTFRAVLRPKEPQPKRGGIETRKLKEGDDAGRDDGDDYDDAGNCGASNDNE